MDHDPAYLEADATDARAALRAAVDLLAGGFVTEQTFMQVATDSYHFLRSRVSLRAVRLSLIPGESRKEGSPMTTTFNLTDTDEVTFTLAGQDAKGIAVPLPDGVTWAWSLADPDATGATLTVSADTLSAVVAAGVPDSNLLLSVSGTVTNPDGSTTDITGAEAIIVVAGPAVTVGLVPGTPSPEPAPAP